MPDLTLPTRYEILRLLGAGGMGSVYEVFDRERGSKMAVKVLHERTGAALVRIRDEFRALAAIHHPNVCRLGELFEIDRGYAFSMELVAGTGFVDAVSRAPVGHRDAPTSRLGRASVRELGFSEPRYDEARLRPALHQLADGLAAIHRAGFIHRDLKPSNVMITPDGRVVILDFGLAAASSSIAPGERMVGTVDYMAPEQLIDGPREDQLTAAVDLYAVGVMLYECLVGRPPFTGDVMQIVAAKTAIDPIPPTVLFPEIPTELDALVVRLLARDPAARPGLDPFVAMLKGSSVPDRRPEQPRSAPRVIGRDPELAQLRAAFEDLAGGAPVIVQVHGSAGIGKTALLDAFVAEVAPHAMLVCVGRCYEREYVRFNSWEPLIDGLSRWLSSLPRAALASFISPGEIAAIARLFPTFERLAPTQVVSASEATLHDDAIRALRAVLARAAATGPIILVIDDLQWDTDDAFGLFLELMAPPAPPLLIVRALETGPATAAALRDRLVRLATLELEIRNLYLGPLDDPSTRSVARALGAADVERVVAEAAGIPLVIVELSRHLDDAGDIAGAIATRVARLDDALARVLRIIALAHRGLTYAGLEVALAIDHATAIARVDALRELRLARSGGVRRADRVEVENHHVRTAALAAASPAALAAGHAALAATFEADPAARPDLRCHHWVLAGQPDRALAAIGVMRTTARDALAFSRAARAVEAVLELALDAPTRTRALRVHADLLALAGAASRAADVYRAAAETATTDVERFDLERLAAEYLLRCGRIDDGLAFARRVGRRVGIEVDASPTRTMIALVAERARLRLRGLAWRPRTEPSRELDACHSLAVGLVMVDFRVAALAQTRAVRLGLGCLDRERAAHGLALEASFAATPGARATAHAEHVRTVATELARPLGSSHLDGMLLAARGVGAQLRGAYGEAVTGCEEARAVFRDRCAGTVWEAHTVEVFAIWSLAWLGRWGEVRRRGHALAREGAATSNAFATTFSAIGWALAGELAEDRINEARRRSRAVMAGWTSTGVQTPHFHALVGETNLDLQDERAEVAYDRLVERVPAIEHSQILRIHQLEVALWELRARVALASARGRDDRLREALRWAGKLDGAGWGRAFAPLVRAGVARARGDHELAAVQLALAIERGEAAGHALHVAAARWRRGRLLAGTAGDALVAQAHAAAAALGVGAPDRVFAGLAP